MKKIFLMVCMCFLISACSKEEEIVDNNDVDIKALTVSCDKSKEKISEGAVLIDVRSKEEYDLGHLDDAVNIPLDVLETNIGKYVNNKETVVIVYCQSGNRSNQAGEKLINLGYKNVYDLGSIEKCGE